MLIPWWHTSLHPSISVLPAEECNDLKGMFFMLRYRCFLMTVLLCSRVCVVNMIARTERRRKASDGFLCYLNFGSLSCLNSNFCLQGENFSLSPLLFVSKKKKHSSIISCSARRVFMHLFLSVCVWLILLITAFRFFF